MDRISKSLLEEFCVEHELSRLPEDKQFEHLAGYLTVRRHYAETFDPADIVTGSGGDTGIDAVAIIANNVLLSDSDMVEELVKINGYLDVVFVFVQADRSSSFNSSKIANLGFGVRDFFQATPQLPRNQMIKGAAYIMEEIYRRSSKFVRGNPSCRLYYVTTGRWQNDQALEARRIAEVKDLQATGLFGDVEMFPIGADGIQRLYNQTKNAISREFLFQNRTVVPEIAGVREAHLVFCQRRNF